MKYFRGGLCAAAILAGACFLYAQEDDPVTILQVIDGNTVMIGGGQRVRLIGVHVPKPGDREGNLAFARRYGLDPARMEAFAREAKEFVEYLVQGQKALFKLESVYESMDHRDEQGRILAYSWFTSPLFPSAPAWLVVDPGTSKGKYDAFLNAIMIRSGLGVLDTSTPFRFGERFLTLEEEARTEGRGLWQALERVTSGDGIQKAKKSGRPGPGLPG